VYTSLKVASPFSSTSRYGFVEYLTWLLSSFIIFPDGASPYLLAYVVFQILYPFMVFLAWNVSGFSRLQGSITYILVFLYRTAILKSRTCSLCQSTECFFIRLAFLSVFIGYILADINYKLENSTHSLFVCFLETLEKVNNFSRRPQGGRVSRTLPLCLFVC